MTRMGPTINMLDGVGRELGIPAEDREDTGAKIGLASESTASAKASLREASKFVEDIFIEDFKPVVA